MQRPADYDHLLRHAQRLFSGATIAITYMDDEIIHIDVDQRRFSFEIGSDDDGYFFDDGMTSFFIPLFSDDAQDCA
jgi:hypothetical protein